MNIIDAYINGFQGAPLDKEHKDIFVSSSPNGLYGNQEHAIKGSGKGKIALPFKFVQFHDSEFGYYEAQTTGDCTSHGARNACYVTKCANIHQRKSAEVYKGRLATEVIYGYRGFSGQGMSPSRAAEFVSKVSGVHLRQKYGKWDLSKYNSNLGSSWGKSGPPRELVEAGKESPVKTVSLVESIDDVLDLVYNGYGLTIASNFGFTNKRDRNGICTRSGSWNHQMSIVGSDDSGQRHKDPLFLIQNSWGPNWVGGPKVLDQPEGSFWIYAETLLGMIRNGECWSFSDFEGFPSKDIDWSEFNEIY